MADLRAQHPTLPGRAFGGRRRVESPADDFAYTDPVDGSVTTAAGHPHPLRRRMRAIVFRLSGTGTEGATLRVYLERFEPNADRHDLPTADVLAPVVQAANEIAEIAARTGRGEPSVVT